MSELKLCPFCGEEARLEAAAHLCLILRWVSCSKCGARTAKHPNEEKVIKEWNSRAVGKLICQITVDGEEILRNALDKTELDGKTLAEWLELLKGYKQLEAELATAKRGRDAAVKDLKSACKLLWSDDSMQHCKFCEHENEPKDTGYCDKCANGNHFKFKPAALCPDTEVQSNG